MTLKEMHCFVFLIDGLIGMSRLATVWVLEATKLITNPNQSCFPKLEVVS